MSQLDVEIQYMPTKEDSILISLNLSLMIFKKIEYKNVNMNFLETVFHEGKYYIILSDIILSLLAKIKQK